MASKLEYMRALRAELKGRYPWANDAAKVERYMSRVSDGLNAVKGGSGYEHDGPASCAAWAAIGGKGKPKLAELRALEGQGE